MYICLDCKQDFSFPGLMHGHDVCPFCTGYSFEPAERCDGCTEIIGESQAKFHLCPNCERKASRKFKELLHKNFTKNELEYLNWEYDGKYFGDEKE